MSLNYTPCSSNRFSEFIFFYLSELYMLCQQFSNTYSPSAAGFYSMIVMLLNSEYHPTEEKMLQLYKSQACHLYYKLLKTYLQASFPA